MNCRTLSRVRRALVGRQRVALVDRVVGDRRHGYSPECRPREVGQRMADARHFLPDVFRARPARDAAVAPFDVDEERVPHAPADALLQAGDPLVDVQPVVQMQRRHEVQLLGGHQRAPGSMPGVSMRWAGDAVDRPGRQVVAAVVRRQGGLEGCVVDLEGGGRATHQLRLHPGPARAHLAPHGRGQLGRDQALLIGRRGRRVRVQDRGARVDPLACGLTPGMVTHRNACP